MSNIDISKGIGAMIWFKLALNEHKMDEEQRAKAKKYRDEIENLMKGKQ